MEQYSRNTKKGKPPKVYLLTLVDDDAGRELIKTLSYDSIDQIALDVRMMGKRLRGNLSFHIQVREKKSGGE